MKKNLFLLVLFSIASVFAGAPLNDADASGDTNKIRFLIDEVGANVNAISPSSTMNPDRVKCTPLFDALRKGNIPAANFLIEKGAKLTRMRLDGELYLNDFDALLGKEGTDDYYSLSFAEVRRPIIEFLLRNGADPETKSLYMIANALKPLMDGGFRGLLTKAVTMSVEKGFCADAKYIIAACQEYSIRNKNGYFDRFDSIIKNVGKNWDPLRVQWAIHTGDYDFMKELVKSGADISRYLENARQNEDGHTLAWCPNPKIIDLCTNAGLIDSPYIEKEIYMIFFRNEGSRYSLIFEPVMKTYGIWDILEKKWHLDPIYRKATLHQMKPRDVFPRKLYRLETDAKEGIYYLSRGKWIDGPKDKTN